jgi:hypothetical protein
MTKKENPLPNFFEAEWEAKRMLWETSLQFSEWGFTIIENQQKAAPPTNDVFLVWPEPTTN